MSGLFGGESDFEPMPKAQAKRTAEALPQVSEQAKKNKRLAASLLTKGWGEPKLSKAGLLGLPFYAE